MPSNFTCSGCTLDTCADFLDKCGQVKYIPSQPGNAAFCIIFMILLVSQLGLGIFYRTWGFMLGMFLGIFLEIAGYGGRVMLSKNPFSFNAFLIYLIPLTIGPAFLTAGIYICLSRIVVVNGKDISRISPRTYSIIFMLCDFISLLLQAVGGGIAATNRTHLDTQDKGRKIMIAGLIAQVVSLVVFLLLWLDFVIRVKGADASKKNPYFNLLRESFRFRAFNYALWLAAILILVRSAYRVAELWNGFSNSIADNETLFMILEGPMIILGLLGLTILHPGFAFDSEWANAAWSLTGKKETNNKELEIEHQFQQPSYQQPAYEHQGYRQPNHQQSGEYEYMNRF